MQENSEWRGRGRGDRNYVSKETMSKIYQLLKQMEANSSQGLAAQQTMADLAKQQAPPVNPILSQYHSVNDQIKDLLGKDKLNAVDKTKLQTLILEQQDLLRDYDKRQGGGIMPDSDESPVTKKYINELLRKLVTESDSDTDIDTTDTDTEEEDLKEDRAVGGEPKASPPPPRLEPVIKEKKKPARRRSTKPYDREKLASFHVSPSKTRQGKTYTVGTPSPTAGRPEWKY